MKSLKEKIQLVVDIYKSGDLLEAEQACKELINENSKVAFLYNLLGLILVGQKKFDQAIKYYELGLKIDPTFSIIYNNLGLLFFEQQTDESIKKAENYYKKSISIDKKYQNRTLIWAVYITHYLGMKNPLIVIKKQYI